MKEKEQNEADTKMQNHLKEWANFLYDQYMKSKNKPKETKKKE